MNRKSEMIKVNFIFIRMEAKELTSAIVYIKKSKLLEYTVLRSLIVAENSPKKINYIHE